MLSNLFGIDHELLNKQIMDYKRLKVSRDIGSIAWTEEQEQQLSKIQKKMKKKKTRNPPDDDITPQKYLLDRYEADDWDDDTELVLNCELEDELQEEVDELETDDGRTLSQPTDKLKWSEKATPFKMEAANTEKNTAIHTERLVLYSLFTTSSFELIGLPHVGRFASTKYGR